MSSFWQFFDIQMTIFRRVSIYVSFCKKKNKYLFICLSCSTNQETEDRHPRACHLRPVDPCAEEPRRVARYGTVLQPAKVESSAKSGPPCGPLRVIAEREAREPKSVRFTPDSPEICHLNVKKLPKN